MDSDRLRSASRTFDDIARSHQRRRLQENQAAYSDDSSHQFGSLQSSPMAYQSDYSPQSGHRQQQSFPPYTSTMMYSLPQSPSVAAHSYNTIQSYPAHRQNAAIEVLSSQFGIPSYYVPESQSSGSNVGTPHQQTQSQYYSQSSSPQRMPPSYTSSIHELTQQSPSTYEPRTEDAVQSQQNQSASFEEAYGQYQTALRGTFQNMRDGRLLEAGRSLLELSTWLLSNVVDLVSGLVRDEQELYADRTRLWNEFNICWLSVLAKEKELIQSIMAGQQLQAPKGILREEALQQLGSELIRLCDNMERHGLVDYQMGVWEEEILDSIQECLDMLERHYGPAATPQNS